MLVLPGTGKGAKDEGKGKSDRGSKGNGKDTGMFKSGKGKGTEELRRKVR